MKGSEIDRWMVEEIDTPVESLQSIRLSSSVVSILLQICFKYLLFSSPREKEEQKAKLVVGIDNDFPESLLWLDNGANGDDD